jgi:hypothetical protein
MTLQYRCFPCQDVFDTIPEWRTHMLTHGEKIFTASGVVDPPTGEERASLDDSLVQSGVKAIIAGTYTSGHNLRTDVQAAIRARLAIDADPWWYMSDDYSVRPKAKLTEEGKEFARTQGWLVKCFDHKDYGGACGQETLSLQAGNASLRCASCMSSLNHFGPPPKVDGVRDLCGMCHVSVMRRTDPTFVLPRRDRPPGYYR